MMVHHLDTPVMVVADQEDHTIGSVRAIYATYPNYAWPSPELFRQRVLDQSKDIVANWDARLEGPEDASNMVFLLRKSRRNNEGWGKANHVHFGDNAKMNWKMTQCSAAGEQLKSFSIADVILGWVKGSLPVQIIAEDGVNWDGASDYWVTGPNCIPPQ